MYYFAGFVLDPDRAELRCPDGSVARLRPKAFELLTQLVGNSHRVLGKEELMATVWPDILVGEDSLFQCIREIRLALGDTERKLVKLVSGRGYRFALDVSTEPPRQGPAGGGPEPMKPGAMSLSGKSADRASRTRIAFLLVGLCALAIAFYSLVRDVLFAPQPTLVVHPITDVAADADTASLSRGVTSELVSGLSRIGGVDLVSAEDGPETAGRATHELRMELLRSGETWNLQARLLDGETGDVLVVKDVVADAGETDARRLGARLAAGIGHVMASRLNNLIEGGDPRPAVVASDVVIEQALASINQTTPERFTTARAILEKSLADDPESVDLKIALAALQSRGLQLNWYDAATSAAAEAHSRNLIEDALKSRPRSLAVMGAYCRFLTATNQFAESLVACARSLTFNPWDGAALYNLGLTQIQLGRFDDALLTFRKAEIYDTPDDARWTWLLGAGWANLLLGRDEQALDFLERSIAITPGSGRPQMLLAAAQWRLGRQAKARETLAKAMALRPGSTAGNIGLPTRNASADFLTASRAVIDTLVEIGLPTGAER